MTTNLPKPVGIFSDDLIHRIAMDIGKQVVAQIDHAHPEVMDAVRSPSSFRLSMRNTVYNAIKSHMEHAEKGQSEQLIEQHEKSRRTLRRLQRAGGSYRE